MNATDILGYAFDGALYCVECLTNPKECTCLRSELDENGLCSANCHGYGPNPVFGDSEDGGTCDACGADLLDDPDMPDGTGSDTPHDNGNLSAPCETCGAREGEECSPTCGKPTETDTAEGV